MKPRVLTEEGVRRFEEYIVHGASGPAPMDLLDSQDASEALPGANVDLAAKDFKDRFEFGRYLGQALAGCDANVVAFNPGLWSWLALFYFDRICPPNADGQRHVYKEYAYVFPSKKGVETSRHYYRHLVRTPYVLVKQHGNNAKVLLSGIPLWQRGELIEQLAARQSLFGSRSVIEATRLLYFDGKKEKFARGATSRSKPGTVGRLIGVLQQFERTFDLHVMTGSNILAVLPEEFDRWK